MAQPGREIRCVAAAGVVFDPPHGSQSIALGGATCRVVSGAASWRRGMITSVRRMLDDKSEVFAVGPADSVYDALRLMAEKNIGAVLVLDRDRIAGILSERDYARKVILHGKSSRETTVAEIMTRDVITIDPTWTAEQCMALMTERRIRHLPVLDRGRLAGIISIGDAVRAVLDEQLQVISSLERYIASGA
jgi:CBS domain-containing protein